MLCYCQTSSLAQALHFLFRSGNKENISMLSCQESLIKLFLTIHLPQDQHISSVRRRPGATLGAKKRLELVGICGTNPSQQTFAGQGPWKSHWSPGASGSSCSAIHYRPSNLLPKCSAKWGEVIASNQRHLDSVSQRLYILEVASPWRLNRENLDWEEVSCFGVVAWSQDRKCFAKPQAG